MPAGKLRTYWEIQENAPVRDKAGQLVDDWKLLRTAAFEVKPIGGSEGARGASLEATATFQLRCRHFNGAHPRLRLKKDGRILQVEGVVNEDLRNRWLVWTVREVV